MAKVTRTLQHACRVLRRRVLFLDTGFRLPMGGMTDSEKVKLATKKWTTEQILPILEAIETGDTDKLQALIELRPGLTTDGILAAGKDAKHK